MWVPFLPLLFVFLILLHLFSLLPSLPLIDSKLVGDSDSTLGDEVYVIVMAGTTSTVVDGVLGTL